MGASPGLAAVVRAIDFCADDRRVEELTVGVFDEPDQRGGFDLVGTDLLQNHISGVFRGKVVVTEIGCQRFSIYGQHVLFRHGAERVAGQGRFFLLVVVRGAPVLVVDQGVDDVGVARKQRQADTPDALAGREAARAVCREVHPAFAAISRFIDP